MEGGQQDVLRSPGGGGGAPGVKGRGGHGLEGHVNLGGHDSEDDDRGEGAGAGGKQEAVLLLLRGTSRHHRSGSFIHSFIH